MVARPGRCTRSGYRPLAPIGLHGLPLSAVMHAWGLLGPEVLQDAAAGGAWRDVSRSGLLDGAPASSEPPLVAPGLLPACEDVPSAFAQEVAAPRAKAPGWRTLGIGVQGRGGTHLGYV